MLNNMTNDMNKILIELNDKYLYRICDIKYRISEDIYLCVSSDYRKYVIKDEFMKLYNIRDDNEYKKIMKILEDNILFRDYSRFCMNDNKYIYIMHDDYINRVKYMMTDVYNKVGYEYINIYNELKKIKNIDKELINELINSL